VYDSTTARINSYHSLQQKCISKLKFEDSDRVLCVGIGTGNEILHIFQANESVNIVGIDYSNSALKRAHQKALKLGKEIQVSTMDVQDMNFKAASFDKVVCLHVMDFLINPEVATSEIFRVLKDGGQFVVTYPFSVENIRMAKNLVKGNPDNNSKLWKSRAGMFRNSLSMIMTGFIYLPLFFRPGKVCYRSEKIQTIITDFVNASFQIEEDHTYHNLIVYGRKEPIKGGSGA
jgi:ubiquinone/menaquinone biosynthesis C-methylase UbiE